MERCLERPRGRPFRRLGIESPGNKNLIAPNFLGTLSGNILAGDVVSYSTLTNFSFLNDNDNAVVFKSVSEELNQILDNLNVLK